MTKTLLGSLREYKKGSILTILLSVLEAAFEILIPLRMADLIDQGIEPGEMAAVWKFGTIILVFAAPTAADRRAFRPRCRKNLGGLFRQSAAGYVRQCADLCLFQH